MSESKRERLARERRRDHRRVYTADTLRHRLDTDTTLTDDERRTITAHYRALCRAEAERNDENTTNDGSTK